MARDNSTNFESWVDVLETRARLTPDKIAFRFMTSEKGDQCFTFKDVFERSKTIAASLQERCSKKDRVALVLPYSPDFLFAILGCILAQVIPVPLYPPRKNRNAGRFHNVIADCHPTVILTNNETQRSLEELMQQGHAWSLLPIESCNKNPGTWKKPALTGNEIVLLQYTSGSTSQPKGVLISHINLLTNVDTIVKAMEIRADSSLVSWLPLYHDMGLVGFVFTPLFVGCEATLMAPAAFQRDPASWIKVISERKGTHTGAPNFAFELCTRKYKAEEFENVSLSSVQVMFSGAEPIREKTIQAFYDVFEKHGLKRSSFFSCYGFAETALFVSGSHLKSVRHISKQSLAEHMVKEATSSEDTVKVVSCGKVADDTTVVVVDPETLKPCGPGRVGEILVASRSISKGYWNRPEENVDRFGIVVSGFPNSFYRTGDLGFTADDELYVSGRVKDMIIISGRNYYPHDIEHIVGELGRDQVTGLSAAFSIEENEREQLVVVVEAGHRHLKSDWTEVVDAIAHRISQDLEISLSRLAVVKPGRIPRTSSGKIQRYKARTEFLANEFEIVFDWRAGVGQVQRQDHVQPKQDVIEHHPSQSIGKQTAIVHSIHSTSAPSDGEKSHAALAYSGGSASLDEIKQFLRETLRKSIRNANADISDHRPFTSYGLDSLSAVEVVVAIEGKYGIKVGESFAWDYPNIESAANYIANALSPQIRAAGQDW